MKKFVSIILTLVSFIALSLAMDNREIGVDLEHYMKVKKQNPQFVYDFFKYFESFSSTNLSQRIDTDDQRCLDDLAVLIQAINERKLWAWRFIDSWGSIPSGLFYGTLFDLGNFDECANIHKELNDSRSISGKYCFMRLPLGDMINFKIYGIKIGICVPSSCKVGAIDALLRNYLEYIFKTNIESTIVAEKTCKTSEPMPLETLSIITITILSIFGIIMIFATLYHYFINKEVTVLNPIIEIFSARNNGREIFKIVDYKKNHRVITCLYGIRGLSLIWVILAHEYLICRKLPNINNSKIYSWRELPFTVFIEHASFSVDSFFLVGGMLTASITLYVMDKNFGKLNIPLMYIHRYLRLTPIVAIGILIHMSLLKYLGNGPLWGLIAFDDDYDYCKDTWWKTILYIQNYAAKEFTCLTQTWYLAVDTQMYFISPIFLIAVRKWGSKGLALVVVFLLLLSACLFTTVMTTDYSLTIKDINFDQFGSQYHLYMATHIHAQPWLVGFIFGYFMYKMSGKTITVSKPVVWLGWITALSLIFTCLFALLQKSQWHASEYTRLQEASYLTLTRIAWPLALSWVIFACHYGYGGFADSFLSSPLWQPVSRLSYCAFIFHSLIQSINIGRVRTGTYFSNYEIMLRVWYDFGITMLLCVAINLIFEAPTKGIILFVLPKMKASAKTRTSTEVISDNAA